MNLGEYLKALKTSPVSRGRTKGGRREDLGNVYFRSAWEANIARYLNYLEIRGWQYERKTFEFKEIKRGTRFYTPDFHLTDDDSFIEVKGQLTQKSKTIFKRFKKYYPDEFAKLVIIGGDLWGKGKMARKLRGFYFVTLILPPENYISYQQIEKKFGLVIKGWEK